MWVTYPHSVMTSHNALLIPIACPRGQYGPGCVGKCSDHCTGRTGECYFRTGQCYQGCEPGFQPPTCHTECPAGTYGPGCDGSCYLGCVQDDQSPMCHRTRVNDQFDEGAGLKTSSISVTLFAVVVVVIAVPAAAVIVGLLVSRFRVTKRHRPRRSSPEEYSARVEFVQVENPAPQPGTPARRGSNQHYEPMELSSLSCCPNDIVFDQYATPLDMERELGEYEMPLNVKQSDLSQLPGQDINKAEKISSANSKRWKSPTGSSNQEILEKKEGSGIYCNSDRLPIGHERRHTKETEKTSVTANNSHTPLTMSYTQLDNEIERRQGSKE
ncbi:hypothetical protein RRG08_059843 [Elysia crispata]|uniref:Uncharacterized protein n=1 Tax=Elysia crispata TaxID=231223 RepID=A0AAE0ZCN9_9GAST|nr:hypothetical protein RRG08_059843 [Elysia crispata]